MGPRRQEPGRSPRVVGAVTGSGFLGARFTGLGRGGRYVEVAAVNDVNRRDNLTPVEPSEVAYLGVEIPSDVLRKYVLKHKSAEPSAQMHHLGATQRFLEL